MITKFLDPKNDLAFKRIFGTETNKDILIQFINDMITFKSKEPIVEVEFLEPIQNPQIRVQKTSIVDVLCRDEHGHQYILEMQVATERGFEKRAQYYAAKAYISQAKKGDQYHDFKEVIFLAITDFIMFPDKPEYKSDHVILDLLTGENDLTGFSFTFLELPKFNKELHELETMVEKWAYFFKNAETTSEKDVPKIFGNDTAFGKAYEELNRFEWNEAELRGYDHIFMSDWKHEGIKAAAQDAGMAEGLAQGMAEGMQQGMAEGMEKGMAEGMTEGLKQGITEGLRQGMEKGREEVRLEMAKSLFEQGVSMDIITKATALTSEKIAAYLSEEEDKVVNLF